MQQASNRKKDVWLPDGSVANGDFLCRWCGEYKDTQGEWQGSTGKSGGEGKLPQGKGQGEGNGNTALMDGTAWCHDSDRNLHDGKGNHDSDRNLHDGKGNGNIADGDGGKFKGNGGDIAINDGSIGGDCNIANDGSSIGAALLEVLQEILCTVRNVETVLINNSQRARRQRAARSGSSDFEHVLAPGNAADATPGDVADATPGNVADAHDGQGDVELWQ
jgi:hypothetical protein